MTRQQYEHAISVLARQLATAERWVRFHVRAVAMFRGQVRELMAERGTLLKESERRGEALSRVVKTWDAWDIKTDADASQIQQLESAIDQARKEVSG